jgi:hypothetical protein
LRDTDCKSFGISQGVESTGNQAQCIASSQQENKQVKSIAKANGNGKRSAIESKGVTTENGSRQIDNGSRQVDNGTGTNIVDGSNVGKPWHSHNKQFTR